MKKLLFLCFTALCMLIASCSKDSGFMPGSDPALEYIKGYPAKGPVVVVPPTGADDTDELSQAINNADPGSVIKLLEGVYHLNYMEIIEFKGCIIGAGPGKTIIYPLTPLNYEMQFSENLVPCWLRFTGGSFIISDMTISTDVEGPIHDYSDETSMGEDLFAIMVLADYNDNHRPGEPFQKALIKNLNVIGGRDLGINGYMTDQNTILGIWCGSDFWWPVEGVDYPLTNGEFTITNCYFDNFLDGAEGFGLSEYAFMKVSNSGFDNCLWPLYFTANHGPRIDISNNTFSRSTDSDVIIEDLDWGILSNTYINPDVRSHYTLTGNVFNVESPAASLILWDNYLATSPEEVPPMKITVKGNTFNLVDGSSGIWAINSQDANILNNRFKGSCLNGIMIEGIQTDRYGNPLPLEAKAKNVLVLGNNFTGLNAITNIVLGEQSINCTIVGSGKESIIDDGTNNKIAGMIKKPDGHIGPTIRDNLRMWRGIRHH